MIDLSLFRSDRDRSHPMLGRNQSKVFALMGAEFVLFSVVAGSFWIQDLRYALPTPVPKGWKAPVVGSRVLASDRLDEPTVFNFYNSDCPCSRFNLDHVRGLQAEFGSRVQFILVLEGGSKSEEEKAFNALDFPGRPHYDVDGSLAKRLGVYATPQAVVLDAKGRLAYRGNYNRNRYCSDPSTEYARLMIESLIAGKKPSMAAGSGEPAYGCAIPATSSLEELR